tara:strand:- start:6308 stop:6733 length:426 start_codon:yes stop_codon:yes gene_type:complete
MNVEHVVIDGGSVDETPAYLTENKELFSYSVSEPDSGIYHAMNKGLEHVTGEWVIYLNAGDVFISDTILNEMVAEYLCKYSEGICTGKVNLYKNGVSLNMTHPRGGGIKRIFSWGIVLRIKLVLFIILYLTGLVIGLNISK